jgi:hypothetical protein
MTRSRTALLKMPCSMTWYLPRLRGDSPPAAASVIQVCTIAGVIDLMGRLPKKGRKCQSR